jgi:hypothetical protein
VAAAHGTDRERGGEVMRRTWHEPTARRTKCDGGEMMIGLCGHGTQHNGSRIRAVSAGRHVS